ALASSSAAPDGLRSSTTSIRVTSMLRPAPDAPSPTRDGPSPDVPSVVHPVERDARRGVVGARDRLLDVRSQRLHAEHTAAGRDEIAIAPGGTRMEHADTVLPLGLLDPSDGTPRLVRLGIAA